MGGRQYWRYAKLGLIPVVLLGITSCTATMNKAGGGKELSGCDSATDCDGTGSVPKAGDVPRTAEGAVALMRSLNLGAACDIALDLEGEPSANGADVQWVLATCYYRGVGAEMNPDKVKHYVHSAIDAGSLEANTLLAQIYARQCRGPSDPNGALDIALESASAGEPIAFALLSQFYRDGVCVYQDKKQALAWAEKGIDAGNADAMLAAGQFYLNDEELLDVDKALRYLQMASDRELPQATTALGNAYLMGQHVPQDFDKGVALLRKAASPPYNFWNAQYMMGLLSLGAFNNHENVYNVDLIEAMNWFEAGKDNRDPASAYQYFSILLKIAGTSNPSEIDSTNKIHSEIMEFSRSVPNTPHARNLKMLFIRTVIDSASKEYLESAIAAAEVYASRGDPEAVQSLALLLESATAN